MKIPTKSFKNGFSMPVYGLGTWGVGGRHERDPQNDDAADIEAIRNAIDRGITHIDTAEVYASGHAEELVGEAIKHYDRKNLFLVSKVYANHLRYDDLIRACKESLKRLGTSYLDVYLTHRPNPPDIPWKETMRAMNTLVDGGLVKYLGVSNYNVREMQEAQSHSKYPLVANQVHYNLRVREVEEKGVLEYCRKNDMLLIAWRPVEKGMLLTNPPDIMRKMMEKYEKTAAQTAINWLISQPNVITLSKTRKRAHLEENLGAVGWEMEKEDIETLRKEFPDQQMSSDVVPLH